ncbi:uncharacterized protein A4U43_C10F15610 [Asparagus officinalis]|uniref:Uncharacterized protein n=1 Tax=Asparagus officinalis TaxID=4686 RepID=A0A5P1E3A7_ASPOF|nr:uncharacterized protein A4U43_C10F15610 [Asparagus officinalis]
MYAEMREAFGVFDEDGFISAIGSYIGKKYKLKIESYHPRVNFLCSKHIKATNEGSKNNGLVDSSIGGNREKKGPVTDLELIDHGAHPSSCPPSGRRERDEALQLDGEGERSSSEVGGRRSSAVGFWVGRSSRS